MRRLFFGEREGYASEACIYRHSSLCKGIEMQGSSTPLGDSYSALFALDHTELVSLFSFLYSIKQGKRCFDGPDFSVQK